MRPAESRVAYLTSLALDRSANRSVGADGNGGVHVQREFGKQCVDLVERHALIESGDLFGRHVVESREPLRAD